MFGHKNKDVVKDDGGEGRDVPLGSHDQPPRTSYRDDELDELTDRDLGLEDEEPGDRRRDPLRKP